MPIRTLEEHEEANKLFHALSGSQGWMESGYNMLNDPTGLLRNWFVFTYKEYIQQVQETYPDAILHYEYSGLDFSYEDGMSGSLYATWYKLKELI